jgi:hypothetical protein
VKVLSVGQFDRISKFLVSHGKYPGSTRGCSKRGDGVYPGLRKGVTKGHGGPGGSQKQSFSFQMFLKPTLT